jgi:hypothetical protein
MAPILPVRDGHLGAECVVVEVGVIELARPDACVPKSPGGVIDPDFFRAWAVARLVPVGLS